MATNFGADRKSNVKAKQQPATIDVHCLHFRSKTGIPVKVVHREEVGVWKNLSVTVQNENHVTRNVMEVVNTVNTVRKPIHARHIGNLVKL